MLRFAADENFHLPIVRALRRRNPDLGIVTAQEAGLAGRPDPEILEWAADQSRILLSRDYRTMRRFAYERVAAGLAMPGVFLLSQAYPIRLAVEQLELLAGASLDGEWDNRVEFLPIA